MFCLIASQNLVYPTEFRKIRQKCNFFSKLAIFGPNRVECRNFWCNFGATGVILCILERQNRKVWLHQKSARNGLNRGFLGKRIAFRK